MKISLFCDVKCGYVKADVELNESGYSVIACPQCGSEIGEVEA